MFQPLPWPPAVLLSSHDQNDIVEPFYTTFKVNTFPIKAGQNIQRSFNKKFGFSQQFSYD